MNYSKKMKDEKRDWLYILFAALIFFLPLWPDYAELKFGGIPNLAPTRLLRLALVCIFFWMIFNDKVNTKLFVKRCASIKWLLIIVVLFYVARFASAFVSKNTLIRLFEFFKNDSFVYLPFVFIGIAAVKTREQFDRIITVLVTSSFFAGLLALLDYYLKHNIFMGVVPVTNDFLMGVFLDKTRDNFYRAQGTFEHPILLGQFAAFAAMLTWVKFKQSKGLWAIFYLITGFLNLAAAYVSGSRGALAIFVLLMILVGAWELINWVKGSKNRVLQYLAISQFPWVIFIGIAVMLYLNDFVVGKTAQTYSSTDSRIRMLEGGIPKVLEQPLIGHGLGEGVDTFSLVGRSGLRTLDNYYLVLGLETGLIAPLLLLFILATASFICFRDSFNSKNGNRYLAVFFGINITYIFQMATHSLIHQFWIVMLSFIAIAIYQNKTNINEDNK